MKTFVVVFGEGDDARYLGIAGTTIEREPGGQFYFASGQHDALHFARRRDATLVLNLAIATAPGMRRHSDHLEISIREVEPSGPRD